MQRSLFRAARTTLLRATARTSSRRLLSSSSSSDAGSGVIAAHWPEGLLQAHQGNSPTTVSAQLASELLYEVGWQSRHTFLDVRPAAIFASGHARGAYNVPFEPIDSFVARAAETVEQIMLDKPPAHHVASASLPHGEDSSTPMRMRLVIGGDDTSSLAFAATAACLEAGYVNAVCLEVGFDAWREMGHPCALIDADEDDFQDSTF